MPILPFLTNDKGPAWLPGAAREARQFAYWGQVILVIFLVISAILIPVSLLLSSWGLVVYYIISVVVDVFLIYQLNQTVFDPLDQGKFKEVSDRLLIWGIIGLIFSMILPGLFLILAFIKLQEVFQPQYQQYPTQYYQAPQQYPGQAPPAQYQAPPPQQGPTQQPVQPEPAQQPKQDMIKCRNCGAQYPSFMRNCPNCGAPRN